MLQLLLVTALDWLGRALLTAGILSLVVCVVLLIVHPIVFW